MHPPQIVAAQRGHFRSGATRSYAARRDALRSLEAAIRRAEPEILASLRADLGKPPAEALVSEVGFVLAEIGHALRNLRHWMAPRRPRTPLLLLPGRSRVQPEPLGVTLILGPWNYPLQLVLSPAVAALAAGNTVVLKPSELAPRTAGTLAELVREALPAQHLTVVAGGAATAESLLRERFDHVFFTGSLAVGRRVAEAAARWPTPCTLELGGKSPCVVCADANLPVAARRIAWGKFLNAGQTCVAPDFVLADRRVADTLTAALGEAIGRFYGPDPQASPDYGRIVSGRHLERLQGLLAPGRIVTGGVADAATRYLAPTLLTDIPAGAPILSEEIFGPILPILPFDDLDAALEDLAAQPTPLALYVFSESRRLQRRVLDRVRSGGACVNDTIQHILSPRLPFGGLGESGQGCYRGQAGFETFSHRRSVLVRGTRLDPPLRYPPARTPLQRLRQAMPWMLR